MLPCILIFKLQKLSYIINYEWSLTFLYMGKKRKRMLMTMRRMHHHSCLLCNFILLLLLLLLFCFYFLFYFCDLELALEIAQQFSDLIFERNFRAVTPLHLIATIPQAFRSATQLGFVESLIYAC